MEHNSAHPSTSAFHGFAGHIATPKKDRGPNWKEEVVLVVIVLAITFFFLYRMVAH